MPKSSVHCIIIAKTRWGNSVGSQWVNSLLKHLSCCFLYFGFNLCFIQEPLFQFEGVLSLLYLRSSHVAFCNLLQSFHFCTEPVHALMCLCVCLCVCIGALCDQLIFPCQRVCSLSAGTVWYLNTTVREEKKSLCVLSVPAYMCEGFCCVHVKLDE